MAVDSRPELLVPHAVRLKGTSDDGAVACRFSLDPGVVAEVLLDDEAYGWVQRVEFAGTRVWALSELGRRENERMLAAELVQVGARETVFEAHSSFVRLNARFLETITKWQVRPERSDPMAANDHSDWRWDEQVVSSLARLSQQVQPIGERLADCLGRFAGYRTGWPPRSPESTRGSGSGSTNPGSTPCTRRGSSFTKTCWRASASSAVTKAESGVENGVEWPSRG